MNKNNTNHTSHSLTILGSEQSGKTCFLAGLGILSEGDRSSDIMLSSEGDSKKFIRELSSIIRYQNWPASTTMEHNFIGTLRYKRRDIKLHMVEYAGEQFREGFSSGREKPQNLVKAINNSQFLLLALDPLVELARDEIMASTNEDRDRYHARLDSLLEVLVQEQRARNGKQPFHVGLLITKADLISENKLTPDQAEAYVKKSAPNFHRKLTQEFNDLRTFAISAVGRTEHDANGRMIPAKVLEPWGYEHVFDWVLGVLKRKKRNNRIIKSISVVAIIVILFIAYNIYATILVSNTAERWEQLVRIGIDTKEMIEEAERLARNLDSVHFEKQVDDMLEESKQQQSNSSLNQTDAVRTLNALRALNNSNNPHRRLELQNSITSLSSKLEENDYNSIKRMYDNGIGGFSEKAVQFLHSYPNSLYKDEVEQWLNEKTQSRFAAEVRKILNITVKNELALKQKIAKIQEFLTKHPNVKNKADIGEAASLATKLIDETQQGLIEIELKELGTLIDEGYLSLKIFLPGSSDPVIDAKSTVKATRYSFENAKEHYFPWRIGQTISIEIYLDLGWIWNSYYLVATQKLDRPFAIQEIDGEITLKGVNGYEKKFIENKPFMKCDVIGWRDEDWKLLNDWIAPGNSWNELITNE